MVEPNVQSWQEMEAFLGRVVRKMDWDTYQQLLLTRPRLPEEKALDYEMRMIEEAMRP